MFDPNKLKRRNAWVCAHPGAMALIGMLLTSLPSTPTLIAEPTVARFIITAVTACAGILFGFAFAVGQRTATETRSQQSENPGP